MVLSGRITRPPRALGLVLTHSAILGAGALFGFALSLAVTALPIDFSSELEEARRLGIVSRTILAGYPESRDLLIYAAVLVLPVFCALAGWLLWVRSGMKAGLAEALYGRERPPEQAGGTAGMSAFFAVMAFYVVASFNINLFYMPGYNAQTGAWPLLVEDGVFLAYSQSIFDGGVYGRDFFSEYGPMMIYPLVWSMKLLGKTVVTERVYTYLLNLAAYVAVAVLLYRSLKSRTLFIIAAVAFFFIYPPFSYTGPHASFFRWAVGLIPLVILHWRGGNNTKGLNLLAGMVAGQGFLFSFEVGVSAAAAVTGYHLFQAARNSLWRPAGTSIGLFVLGFLLSLLPLGIYFWLRGALLDIAANIYSAPKLYMLGFGALPFPPPSDLFRVSSCLGALFFYWPLFVFIVISLRIVPAAILRRSTVQDTFLLSLLLYGIVLFRSALGRSDDYHLYMVSQPAFLLLFLSIDAALIHARGTAEVSKFVRMLPSLLLCGMTVLVVMATPLLKSKIAFVVRELGSVQKKMTRVQMAGSVPELLRGGIDFDARTAASLKVIGPFLNSHMQQGDLVYFFPGEPAFYFLFDRANPTLYPAAYSAATAAQRQALIRQLEEKKPRYVVYSLRTWRPDGIDELLRLPEVVSYLKMHYATVVDTEGIRIMERQTQ